MVGMVRNGSDLRLQLTVGIMYLLEYIVLHKLWGNLYPHQETSQVCTLLQRRQPLKRPMKNLKEEIALDFESVSVLSWC